MFKVTVLMQLCPDLMPDAYKHVMRNLLPPINDYQERIDRRLEGCYCALLDIYGLKPYGFGNEVETLVEFISDFTDESSIRARSQAIRFESVKTLGDWACEITADPACVKISDLKPLEERLRYYKGWYIPSVGMEGQYVDLSRIYMHFGEFMCLEMQSSLIDYTCKMHRETARGRTQSVIMVGEIFSELFAGAADLKSRWHIRLVDVLERIWLRCFGKNGRKTDVDTLFNRAISVLNEFYVAYGFIDRSPMPLSARAAKVLLKGGMSGRQFN